MARVLRLAGVRALRALRVPRPRRPSCVAPFWRTCSADVMARAQDAPRRPPAPRRLPACDRHMRLLRAARRTTTTTTTTATTTAIVTSASAPLRRPACGLLSHWTAVEDRLWPLVDLVSYQKRKIKNFVLSILWTAIADSPNRLSSEGLASLPRSLTFPLQVTSEFFN